MSFSGGCQCGAVRFRVETAPRQTSLCHCRMCQKATGGLFGPYANFPTAALTWTRGQRKLFQSSQFVVRGFCGDCGTPLTFEAASGDGDHIGLTIGAFDDPSALKPQRQIKVADRIPWTDDLASILAATPPRKLPPPANIRRSSRASIPTTTPRPGRRSVDAAELRRF